MNGTMRTRDDFEDKLVRKVMGYVNLADMGEEVRRRSDRQGARILHGHHWGVNMPADRAAITSNIAMALIMHKIAIQTKLDPIPVIEPDEVGDATAATIMRSIVMRVWREDGLKMKIRRGQLLANATRTAALHVYWDPTKKGGNGDIATEVVPGWSLIVDNRTSDPRQMQFCGHRAVMSRAKAMNLYPEHAKRIEADDGDSSRSGRYAFLRPGGSPLGSPFKNASAPSPGVATINGQPAVTAFAGDVAQTSTGQKEDVVEIVEMYHIDPTMYEVQEIKRDHLGEPVQEIERDEMGMPQFDQLPDTLQHFPELGMALPVPGFKIRTSDIIETKNKRMYPHWRRTTILMPGEVYLEDIAHDGPLPYAFHNDMLALDGFITRGTLLQCNHLQGFLNIALSNIADNMRMGAIKAWLAGSQSGLATNQIIPGIGQVIPVQDITQIKPLDVPGLDGNMFTLLDKIVALMEKIVGTEGVMQGESAGRVDSAAGYDLLAEIGGSRMVESTQRLETTIADWATIVGWFAQKYYTQNHAISVEGEDGNLTWQRAYGPFLQGTFSYTIATGSTMAWSESAVRQRLQQDLQMGIIDKIEYWRRTNTPNWQQIAKRLQQQNPILSGPAASPPKRTRASVKTQPGQVPRT